MRLARPSRETRLGNVGRRDQQRRDDDNMLASFKAGRDGVADALGVDDNKFVTSFEVCDPVEDGAVRVTIQERAQ